jgi:succinylglutamic semialdehyde dehydrogenase
LEMGGNTPLVVWDSTDLRGAVWIAIQSCYVTSGQRCSSVRRLIVKTGDFGASFIEAFRDAVSRLVVGDPFGEPQPFMGPVVSAASAERVLFFQKSLIERGGVSILESTQVGDVPALLSPGIVDVSTCSYSQDEEVLGPLVTLRLVELFEDAVAEADRTRYGLAAALISEDPGLFEQFRNGVETGIVSWNAATTGNSGRAAFGGVKASGNYRPTGYYSCDYTTRAVGGTENETVPPATKLSPGVSL